MAASTPIPYSNNTNNKKYSYTSAISPSFKDNERHPSIPATYLTAPSFTDSLYNPHSYNSSNSNIDNNNNNNNNNNDFHDLSSSPYNFRRRSSMLQAETLKNSFNDLDESSVIMHHQQQSSPLSGPKDGILIDIDNNIHPLASDIKGNTLSPLPVNIIQKNNQQPSYFRQPSIFEHVKEEEKEKKEKEEDDNINNKKMNLLYCPLPYIEQPFISKDLHIALPDRRLNYFDHQQKSMTVSFNDNDYQQVLPLLPYPFRKRESVHKRLKRKNGTTINNSSKETNQSSISNNNKQDHPSQSIDYSRMDRLVSINSSSSSDSSNSHNTAEHPKNNDKYNTSTCFSDSSLISSWLDTSVNIKNIQSP